MVGFSFIFNFWKDSISIEFESGGNPTKRFEFIRQYSNEIIEHGFKIDDPVGNDEITLEEGLRRHWTEYLNWIGLVERVTQITNPSN